ncbi:MAG: hypothetical protein NT115_00500 [Proteobacteria bacterium]|nr:hypothetical protein [Pseudomonadota bacterium]
MKRMLRHALLALTLLFSQQAAQLHAMGHLGEELAAAAHGEQGAPPAGHPAEHCLAFHAIDGVPPGIAQPAPMHCGSVTPVVDFTRSPSLAMRVVFDSRAPPALS